MPKKEATLGELELEVLKTIWRHQPCSVQKIAGIFGKRKGRARTTVLTVMQRLHAKGFLKRRKVDGVFQYSSTQTRREVVSSLIRQFLDKVLDGSAAPFVTYLTETKDLSRQQVAALREIARQLGNEEGESK